MEMNFTYGAELEFGLLDRTIPPILGCEYSNKEMDVASRHPDGSYSCSDPKNPTTPGGEVNTPPTNSIKEQEEIFKEVVAWQPQVNINHRLHLHTHIAFPGIQKDLKSMKLILSYAEENSGFVFNHVYNPTRVPAMNRYAWNYQVADRVKMPAYKYKFCMEAETVEDFSRSFAKTLDGRINNPSIRRYFVNVYSIFRHGTIEFRHFFPTLDSEEVRGAFLYSERFVTEALTSRIPVEQWFFKNTNDFFADKQPAFNLPKEQPFDEGLDLFWQEHNFKAVYGFT